MQALQTKNYKEAKNWLTYWLIFCFIQVINPWLEIIIYTYYQPYLYLIQLFLITFMFHPYTKGHEKIYKKYIKGYLK